MVRPALPLWFGALPVAPQDPFEATAAGGRLWHVEADALVALDPDGREVFRAALPCTGPRLQVSSDATLGFLECPDDLIAVSLSDGAVQWRLPDSRGLVEASGVVSSDGVVLDPHTAAVLARHVPTDPFERLDDVAGGLLVVESRDEVRGYDHRDRLRWTAPGRNPLAYAGGTRVALEDQGWLRVVVSRSGRTLGGSPVRAVPLVAVGDEVWARPVERVDDEVWTESQAVVAATRPLTAMNQTRMLRVGADGEVRGEVVVPAVGWWGVDAVDGRVWTISQGVVRTTDRDGTQRSGPPIADQVVNLPRVPLLGVADGARALLYLAPDLGIRLRTDTGVERVEVGPALPGALALSADGARVAVTTALGEAFLGVPTDPRPVALRSGEKATSVVFSDDGAAVFLVSSDGGTRLSWRDGASTAELASTPLPSKVAGSSLVNASPGRVRVSTFGRTLEFDASGRAVRSWTPPFRRQDEVVTSADGAVSAHVEDSTVTLRSTVDGAELGREDLPGPVQRVVFDPTGRVLVAVLEGGGVARVAVPATQPLPLSPLASRSQPLVALPRLTPTPPPTVPTLQAAWRAGDAVVGLDRERVGYVGERRLPDGVVPLGAWDDGSVLVWQDTALARRAPDGTVSILEQLDDAFVDVAATRGGWAWASQQDGAVHVGVLGGRAWTIPDAPLAFAGPGTVPFVGLTNGHLVVNSPGAVVAHDRSGSGPRLPVEGCLLAAAPGQPRVAVSTHVGPVVVWDVAGDRVVAVLEAGAECAVAAFSPDGSRVATWTREALIVFDLARPDQPVAAFAVPDPSPRGLAWAGDTLVAGSDTGTVRLHLP